MVFPSDGQTLASDSRSMTMPNIRQLEEALLGIGYACFMTRRRLGSTLTLA